jgi:hypothetical protein
VVVTARAAQRKRVVAKLAGSTPEVMLRFTIFMKLGRIIPVGL